MIPEKCQYYFQVKGTYPSGMKAKLSGRVTADAPPDDSRLAPASAFDAAIKVAQSLYPGLVVDLSVGGNVVLRRLKGKKNG